MPTVVTAHGPVNGEMGRYDPGLGDSIQLVAVSDAQRRLSPDLNWIGTVHNAVRVERFPFRERKDDYALFLGRACVEKGIPQAIGPPAVPVSPSRSPPNAASPRRRPTSNASSPRCWDPMSNGSAKPIGR